MRKDLITLLESLNKNLNEKLLSVDISKYVDKILMSATIITICRDAEIKAFIAFYENDNNKEVAFLTMIAVSKECWHSGYGKSLLEFSINEITKKGFKLYRLQVKEDNFKALKLYKKYGFIRTGVDKGIVNMEKRL